MNTPNLLPTNRATILETLEIQGLNPQSTIHIKTLHLTQANLTLAKILPVLEAQMPTGLSTITKIMTNTITTTITLQIKISTLGKKGVSRK